MAFLIPVITTLDHTYARKRASFLGTQSVESNAETSVPSELPVQTASTETTGLSPTPELEMAELNIPLIDNRGVLPRAIVLAPTRELASQIHIDARRLTFQSKIKSVCVYGGNDIRAQLQELSSGCELIVATPGRLNDLVDRGCVSLSQVNFLVLDEADRMLDMGFEVSLRLTLSFSVVDCQITYFPPVILDV